MGGEKKLHVIAIGPQKTATTWLHRYFENRSETVVPSEVKEIFFWDRNYQSGLDYYWSHFPNRIDSGKIYCEIAPTCFTSPLALERIKKHNHDIKIIVSLRDPVLRSESLYWHYRKMGRVRGSLISATEQFPEILEGSRYSKYLPEWLRGYPEKNVLVTLYEDLVNQPDSYVDRLCTFLEIPYKDTEYARQVINKRTMPRFPLLASMATQVADIARKKRLYGIVNMAKRLGLKKIYKGRILGSLALEEDERDYLRSQLRGEKIYVESLLGRDLSFWVCGSQG